MKILVISPSGDGIGLAHQLTAEGHSVVVHFTDPWDSQQGEGMLWKSNDWEKDAKAADFVLFDQNGKGSIADRLRKEGLKVWNGGTIADRLEHDRTFGSKVMEKAGIPVPETFFFGNASEAKKIIEANFKPSERVVVKLNKATSASSYCSKDREDCIGEIESWEKHYAEAVGHGGIIQKFTEGTEVSVEGWFNGTEFVYPFNWTMEDKKLLAGNLGPNVGCAFSMVRQMRARSPKIARTLLLPLVPLLTKAGYVGQIDVNAIVSDDGEAYALEFTPRPGYEGTSNLGLALGGKNGALTGLGDAIGTLLGIRVGGDSSGFLGASSRPWDFVAALRLYIPPYPFETMDKALYKAAFKTIEGTPMTTDLGPNEGFVPYDVKKNEDGKMVMAGTCGVVGITLGSGRTPREATDQCLRLAREVDVPNLAYRVDAGDRVDGDLKLVEDLLR